MSSSPENDESEYSGGTAGTRSPGEAAASPVLDTSFEYADTEGYTFEARLELLNFEDVSSSIEQAPPGRVDISYLAGYRLVVANTTEGREAPFRSARLRVYAGESPGQEDCSYNRGPRDPEGTPGEPTGTDPRFCHELIWFPRQGELQSIPPGGELVLERLDMRETTQVSESNKEATLALLDLEEGLSGVSIEISYSIRAQPGESEFYIARDGSLVDNCAYGTGCGLNPMDPTGSED